MSTATETTRVALEAAHRSQIEINAFTFIDDTGAMEQAALVDRTMRDAPLAGVPIGLKDLIDQKGLETTCGSAFYREKASANAACVERLLNAGGVIVGRTGLHEWAFGFSSENPHWGPVRNPWDLDTSTGGSSGGSGAAVAAGITPIAIGTDTGGSVRVPAALCGTFGLKVTHGRIPLDGVFPLVSSIDTVGPLADSMANIERAYRVMADDDTPATLEGPLSIGIPQPWYDQSPTSSEIASAFEGAVETIRDLGHTVTAVEMPDVYPSHQLWHAIAEEVRDVHRDFRRQGLRYGADVDERLSDADDVSDADRSMAREWQSMIRSRFAEALSEHDFLITPTVPVRQKKIGEESIGNRHYRAVLSYFSAVVNHSLNPALAVPLADSGAPPASLQIIGPFESEADLIFFGTALEASGIVAFSTPPGNSPKPRSE